MVAVLGAYGSALALEHATGRHRQLVILAVVLAVSLERGQRTAGSRQRLLALVTLPLVAAAATGVGRLLVSDPDLGDGLFVVAIAGSIWIRRLGPLAARAGSLVALPFVALLATPVLAAPAGSDPAVWAAIVALIAFAWVTVVHLLPARPALPADRGEKLPLSERKSPRSAGAGGSGASGARAAAASMRRVPASTRMAAQMGVALAAAFVVGRAVFPDHWGWVVLTAFIVCSGNRGRGDVVHKSGLRIAGAGIGTAAATIAAGWLPVGSSWSVVAIFALLGLAIALRPVSYALWAAGVTAVLALLYGYVGQSGGEVLAQRLLGVGAGAAIGVAASWLVLPVRSHDVLRRRAADALAALSDVLGALRADPAALPGAVARFDVASDALAQIAPALRAERRAQRLVQRAAGRPAPAIARADAIDAIIACRAPVDALAATGPEALAGRPAQRSLGLLAREVGTIRRAIAGRPSPEPPAPGPPPPGAAAPSALGELAAAISVLASVPLGPRGQRSRRRPQRNSSRRQGSSSDET